MSPPHPTRSLKGTVAMYGFGPRQSRWHCLGNGEWCLRRWIQSKWKTEPAHDPVTCREDKSYFREPYRGLYLEPFLSDDLLNALWIKRVCVHLSVQLTYFLSVLPFNVSLYSHVEEVKRFWEHRRLRLLRLHWFLIRLTISQSISAFVKYFHNSPSCSLPQEKWPPR